MEINIVKEVNYEFKNEMNAYFQRICEKTKKILNLETEYVFSIILVNDKLIHNVNKQYREIDAPTDVISFATHDNKEMLQTEECELGDIFINIDAIERQSKEYGHSYEREFCFLFTHGLLHLLGYDHMNPKDEKNMFTLQDEILDEIINR